MTLIRLLWCYSQDTASVVFFSRYDNCGVFLKIRQLWRYSQETCLLCFSVDSEYAKLRLGDLTMIATLGVGGFGRVELVSKAKFSVQIITVVFISIITTVVFISIIIIAITHILIVVINNTCISLSSA